MRYTKRKKAVLLLEDGTCYDGFSIGKVGTTGGEVCFNTGMTGYQEIYTDPSYYGQVVVNTNSHIGNYGIIESEVESASVKIKGLAVRNFSDIFSRLSAKHSLQDYLEMAGIVGIAEIDTRALVRHIRHKGAMNCLISSEDLPIAALKDKLKNIPDMKGLELSSFVTTDKPFLLGSETAKYRIAVLDLGIKRSILQNFVERGAVCRVFPARTTFAQMEEWKPDGYFISNGPGDPASMDYAIETVRHILAANKPIFGICLGHQILAQAVGIGTYKMHNGHRGLNHPVKNLVSGKCEITSQNHGFAVSREQLEAHIEVEETHRNLNDNTVAGIRLKNKKAFSVQYHPESAPGPHDSRYLFDDFIALLQN
ncbi:glutamine-hydrolyzing carbamoyl-phosphate synthase small subunit [Hugenholtzia roseola]|uniref:glutamine-hydrolyzing carbamoyl-phosphate synthase small subunit n=1 Tax=Hugenholtzia roseola TaxID=1002 RepID=UPI0003FD6017|nr:glutamine-hydrolyzing carbamoyl-phosphate synthase small subunit [Hugenholtzia roseola]